MVQILLTFYRNFFIVTGSVSFAFSLMYGSTTSVSYGFTLLWMKLITNFLIGLLFIVFNNKALIFYNNLGYSSLKMYVGVMVLDILIWSAMMGIILLIR